MKIEVISLSELDKYLTMGERIFIKKEVQRIEDEEKNKRETK